MYEQVSTDSGYDPVRSFSACDDEIQTFVKGVTSLTN
jgi:hypothetical protein